MYNPRLDPRELRAAAAVIHDAAAATRLRAADIDDAPGALTSTGFSGHAAEAGIAGFPLWAGGVLGTAVLFDHAAEILASTATAQEKLDQLAYLAMNLHLAEAVRQLNAISALLDSRAARALRELANTPAARGDRLTDHPGEPLSRIDAHLAPTLPASTLQTIRAAGGMVLETGPGGTTVMVGGDPIDPARVTTLVAGVSTGRPEQLAGELARAQRIAEATGGPVVVWQGYTPPPSVVHGIDPVAARAGGEELAAFQAALDARYPRAQQTVVAHSYGTVVAARAALGPGLHVDDLWLLGSPGVAARSVETLQLVGENPRVFVADADRDPIRATRFRGEAVHGYSPSAESFGATRVDGVRGDHGAYFTDPVLLEALSRAKR